MFSPKQLIPSSRTGLLGAALALCFITIAPQDADARSGWQNRIPNDSSCGTCHLNPGGGGTRNAFGLTVADNLGDRGPEWASIYNIDSDGDGFTNGEELCDPDGLWTPGSPDPTCDEVTDPADPNSKPAGNFEDMGFADMGPADMGPADMGPADMELPVEMDMGSADMDAPGTSDMDAPGASDMSTSGGADMGSAGGADMGSAGGADMGSDGGEMTGGTEDDEDDEGCSQAGLGGAPAGGGLGLLAMAGLVGLLRRRRA